MMGCLDGAPSSSPLPGVHSLIMCFGGEVEETGKRKQVSPANTWEIVNGKEIYKQFILRQKYFDLQINVIFLFL